MPRSNMYIVALLSWAEGSSQGKIRNLSATGALVEASIIPPAGTGVRLVRGSLHASGSIAWASHGRCGVRFDSLVSVSQWMAPTKNNEQTRIDETIVMLKAGASPAGEVRGPRPMMPSHEQLGRDLAEVSRLLEALAAELTSDPSIVAQFGSKLQAFDIATQTLEVAASLLSGSCEPKADVAGRLENLRASRAQAR